MAIKKEAKALSKRSKAQPTNKRPRRKYNNSSRSEKSQQTQKAIIDALVALLVERKGGDVPVEDIAKRSGINQRTLFRFFKDKKSLHQAMNSHIAAYLQSSSENLKTMNFVGFSKYVFELFDRHEALTTAYVLSPLGNETRSLLRKKLNHAMIAQICHEQKRPLTPELQKRLAILTSLVNAKIWYDLRSDYGYSGKEMADTLEWALTTLLKNC